MSPFLALGVPSGAVVSLASTTADGAVAYGLLALVIVLIAWSKFKEPDPSDPNPEIVSADAGGAGRSALPGQSAEPDVVVGAARSEVPSP